MVKEGGRIGRRPVGEDRARNLKTVEKPKEQPRS